MISIIISSYQPHYFSALANNIAETCGLPHEIIKIHNPGLMGICEAYNKGAEKAKYEYLLFLHEDVLFHTENWGSKLIQHFNNPNCGLLGLAGSNYIPYFPWGWHVPDVKYNYINIIQNDKTHLNSRKITLNVDYKPSKVFALDGVFLAAEKNKFNQIQFSKHLKGFHGYDTEISLRFAQKYLNYVISDIEVEHFSEGSTNKSWFVANIHSRKHIKNKNLSSFNEGLEIKILRQFLETARLHQVKISLSSFIKYLHPKFSLRRKYHLIRYFLEMNKSINS